MRQLHDYKDQALPIKKTLRARSFDLEQRPGTIPAKNDIQIYISGNEWNDSWPGISLTERPLSCFLEFLLRFYNIYIYILFFILILFFI